MKRSCRAGSASPDDHLKEEEGGQGKAAKHETKHFEPIRIRGSLAKELRKGEAPQHTQVKKKKWWAGPDWLGRFGKAQAARRGLCTLPHSNMFAVTLFLFQQMSSSREPRSRKDGASLRMARVSQSVMRITVKRRGPFLLSRQRVRRACGSVGGVSGPPRRAAVQ